MPKNPITSNGIIALPVEITIPTDTRDILRVTKNVYKGVTRVDIRWWYESADESIQPGPRGISLSPEAAKEVAKAINSITGVTKSPLSPKKK